MQLLLVEDDDLDTLRIERFLREGEAILSRSGAGPSTIFRVRDLSGAVAASVQHPAINVVLLDLELPDSSGLDTLRTFLARSSLDCPHIVLTGHDDETLGASAVGQGAEDYLIKEELTGRSLARSLNYAVERWRLRVELAQARVREREQRELSLIGAYAPQAPVTAQFLAQHPLRDRYPEEFRALVSQYEVLLDVSLEQRHFKVENRLPEQLGQVGNRLGQLQATPGDVVDVHRTALSQKVQNIPAKKVRAYAEEGRLILLGVMAKLVSHYRARSVSLAGSRTPPEP